MGTIVKRRLIMERSMRKPSPAEIPIVRVILALMLLVLSVACNRHDSEAWTDERFGKPEGVEDFMEITWLLETSSKDEVAEEESSWFRRIVENHFNVSIIPVEFPLELGIAELLASDQFPDCALLDWDPYHLLRDGAIRTLPESMIRSNMPNYSRFLDEEFLPGWRALGENRIASREYEKEYLTLVFPAAADTIPQEGVATRVDWAKSVGIEFPNYEESKIPLNREENVFWLNEEITVDWWENLLRAYREGDPDGNGRIDTIPWPSEKDGAIWASGWMWTGVRGCFGPVKGFVIEGGELTTAKISEGYRQWCKVVQRWVAEGLVDRDNFDRTAYFAWKKIAQGQIGAAPVYLSDIDQDPASVKPPDNMGGEGKAEVVVVPPLVGPEGKRGPYALPHWRSKYFFRYDMEDAKLERMLKIIEFLYCSGEENFLFSRFGKPGIHFRWEGNAWNSQPIPKALKDVPKGYPRIGGFGEMRVWLDMMIPSDLSGPPIWKWKAEIPGINAYTFDLMKFEVPERIYSIFSDFLSGSLSGNRVKWPKHYDIYYDEDYRQIMNKHIFELSRHVNTFFWGITRGWIDVDKEWNGYVEGWKIRGGEEILSAIKDLPSVMGILADR
jgi:hypothetical protein